MMQHINLGSITLSMYELWNIVSAAVMIGYVLLQLPHFLKICPTVIHQKSDRKGKVLGIAEQLTIIIVTALFFTILNKRFGDWFTSGNANYYGSLTAWFTSITVLSIVFKVNPQLVHDSFAPALPIQLFFAKLACFFHGCCSGFEMPGSWYFNQYTGRYEFPVQMVEALVALAIFFFLLYYRRRNKLTGSIFPVYLIAYCLSRFITEFLRADLPKNVLGPLDTYQVMSVIYLLNGLILLFVVREYGERIEGHYSKELEV